MDVVDVDAGVLTKADYVWWGILLFLWVWQERNHQFRCSENCYTVWCGLSLSGIFGCTSLKETTVPWLKPQYDTEQCCWYWKWMEMTLMVSSGFSSMATEHTACGSVVCWRAVFPGHFWWYCFKMVHPCYVLNNQKYCMCNTFQQEATKNRFIQAISSKKCLHCLHT